MICKTLSVRCEQPQSAECKTLCNYTEPGVQVHQGWTKFVFVHGGANLMSQAPIKRFRRTALKKSSSCPGARPVSGMLGGYQQQVSSVSFCVLLRIVWYVISVSRSRLAQQRQRMAVRHLVLVPLKRVFTFVALARCWKGRINAPGRPVLKTWEQRRRSWTE
jgi:hypothetical protein